MINPWYIVTAPLKKLVNTLKGLFLLLDLNSARKIRGLFLSNDAKWFKLKYLHHQNFTEQTKTGS